MDSLQFLATSLVVLFALLFYRYVVRRRQISIKIKPPQAAGAWPIIGHLHLLGGDELPHKTLGAMADKYGPAFMMRLGVHQTMVVSDSEVAKECFTVNDKVLASRSSSLAIKLMGYNYAMFGFGPYGPYWRELRKIVMLNLLSRQQIESLKLIWSSEISMSTKELYQLWASRNEGQGPVLVEMKQWFSDLTLNVAVRMVAGKRYFGEITALDENESKRFQKAIRDFMRLVGLFAVSDYIPFLEWLDLQGYEKEMKNTAKEVDSMLQGWLDEHRMKRQSGRANRDQDFMDVMLSVLNGSSVCGYDADTVNKATCFTMVVAGSDTTMATLTWALSLLLNHPHVLRKAKDELDVHVGKDRNVDESDIKNLVYLQAIVKETMRVCPIAPLIGPQEAMEDCTIAGYHVPAGTRLIVNIWKIQRDPSIWANPCEFQPERFLNIDIDMKGKHFEFIPFGSGRRVCPGISLAFQVVCSTLAHLLHDFEFTMPMEGNVDMTESIGLVNAKATNLDVFVTPRISPKLYA